MDITALQTKAKKYLQVDKLNKASVICKKIIKKYPDDLFALHMLGRISYRQDKYNDTTRYLERALNSEPNNPDILLEYGRALRLTKQCDKAVKYLRQSLSINVAQLTLVELGLSLADGKHFDEAKISLKEALAIKPDCVFSLRRLAYIAQHENNLEQAINYYEKMVELWPDNIHAYPEIIRAHLQRSNPKKALEYCNKCLELEPACTGVIAFQYIAHSELDNRKELNYLFNTKEYLHKIAGETSDNSLTLDNFNTTLSQYILTQAPKNRTPDRYTTRHGWQTQSGELFLKRKKLGSQVHRMIKIAVKDYLLMIPDDINHPVLKGKPSETYIKSWAVVVNAEGYQDPHVHPESWISGVYYVDLPDDFETLSTDAGSIVFGQGERILHPASTPDTITIKPEEGMFVLFPSYFWHHTIPLQSNNNRICIAFDIVPTKGWGK